MAVFHSFAFIQLISETKWRLNAERQHNNNEDAVNEKKGLEKK
jgi:hypothetical protein